MPKRKARKGTSKKATAKKRKKVSARPKKRKTAAKVKRKTAVKAKKRTVKKMAKKIMKKKTSANVNAIGRVTHYYDRIGVAIVKLKRPVQVGDVVKMKHGEHEWIQPVQSLQIDHQPVTSAKKGAVIGLKVSQEVKEGAVVMPA